MDHLESIIIVGGGIGQNSLTFLKSVPKLELLMCPLSRKKKHMLLYAKSHKYPSSVGGLGECDEEVT